MEIRQAKAEISVMIDSYRCGFLDVDPGRLASIWDRWHAALIYVAQEKEEPIYGWAGIEQYFAALPEHIEKMLSKVLTEMEIDVLGDTAIAFFNTRSEVKLKQRQKPYSPTARVTMIFRLTGAGWRVVHYHESALSAQSRQVQSEMVS
jgi:ketosteroid isomerase-like protein